MLGSPQEDNSSDMKSGNTDNPSIRLQCRKPLSKTEGAGGGAGGCRPGHPGTQQAGPEPAEALAGCGSKEAFSFFPKKTFSLNFNSQSSLSGVA